MAKLVGHDANYLTEYKSRNFDAFFEKFYCFCFQNEIVSKKCLKIKFEGKFYL